MKDCILLVIILCRWQMIVLGVGVGVGHLALPSNSTLVTEDSVIRVGFEGTDL